MFKWYTQLYLALSSSIQLYLALFVSALFTHIMKHSLS